MVENGAFKCGQVVEILHRVVWEDLLEMTWEKSEGRKGADVGGKNIKGLEWVGCLVYTRKNQGIDVPRAGRFLGWSNLCMCWDLVEETSRCQWSCTRNFSPSNDRTIHELEFKGFPRTRGSEGLKEALTSLSSYQKQLRRNPLLWIDQTSFTTIKWNPTLNRD